METQHWQCHHSQYCYSLTQHPHLSLISLIIYFFFTLQPQLYVHTIQTTQCYVFSQNVAKSYSLVSEFDGT